MGLDFPNKFIGTQRRSTLFGIASTEFMRGGGGVSGIRTIGMVRVGVLVLVLLLRVEMGRRVMRMRMVGIIRIFMRIRGMGRISPISVPRNRRLPIPILLIAIY